MNSLLTAIKPVWTVLAAVCAVGLASGQAAAQGVYRIVGQDGRVTYSDQPAANNAEAAPVGGATANAGSSTNPQLPLALRQIVNRYPVSLYTGKDCAPCNTGRNLLINRGIPFSEKTVSTTEDVEAFKRLSGDLSLPLLSIGSQRLKGFSDGEWTNYLNAAGYPLQSSLPSNYSRPSPSPMVDAKAATPAPRATAKSTERETLPETPVVPKTVNPAGIRF
jgi:hypothetical protein